MCEEYAKRANAFVNVNLQFVKEKDYQKYFEQYKKQGAKIILLDEKGKEFTSIQFAEFLKNTELKEKQILFAIGHADGFGVQEKNRADFLLSLSKLTISHEIASVLFAETLYRSLSINAGHPYHRP